MRRTLGSTEPGADKGEDSCCRNGGRKGGPGAEKPLWLRNLRHRCKWVLHSRPPHVKTEEEVQGGGSSLGLGTEVLGAGRCWAGGLDAQQRPRESSRLRCWSRGRADPAPGELFVRLNLGLQTYKLWRPFGSQGEPKPVLLLGP